MYAGTRNIEIVGGGLAGLVAGLLLRRRGLSVSLREAASYPRHRVCGEFLCGLEEDWISDHGLASLFAGAARNRTCAWFMDSARPFHEVELPAQVLGISRFLLDQRLSDSFASEGGDLKTNDRATLEPAEGRILACGRPPGGKTQWVGLKTHLRNEPLAADLEVHLGHGGYVGLARIEENKINVCGLFPAGVVKSIGRDGRKLAAAAEAIGLKKLSQRLLAADWVEGSSAGCAASSLGWQSFWKNPASLSIGDAAAMIPPFTGNGMTMAIHAGAAVVPHAETWARGELAWTKTVARARGDLNRTFRTRLRWSGWSHPLLLRPAGQKMIVWLSSRHLLPFHLLFRLTH